MIINGESFRKAFVVFLGVVILIELALQSSHMAAEASWVIGVSTVFLVITGAWLR